MFIAQPLRTHRIYHNGNASLHALWHDDRIHMRRMQASNLQSGLLWECWRVQISPCWLAPLKLDVGSSPWREQKNTVRCYKSRSPSPKNNCTTIIRMCLIKSWEQINWGTNKINPKASCLFLNLLLKCAR